jgi:secondary thiamine-phosphate synthase enzyme
VRDDSSVIVFEEFDTKTGGQLDALDVTDDVSQVVAASGITRGTALVFSPHTTCCVTIASSRQAAINSLERARRSLAPVDGYYAHDDLTIRTENLVEHEFANAPAHILHAFMGGASTAVPVIEGRLGLGPEQRLLFVELDCSRLRRYCIQVVGE